MDPYRLPTDVVPEHYRIHLAPDLEAGAFSGSMSVQIRVELPVSEIVLNAVDLAVRSASLRSDGRERPARVRNDEGLERLTLTFDGLVPTGTHHLDVQFEGVLNDRLQGFYRSTYTSDDGSQRTLAVTQFEATDARRAFPCWDEPAFKAVFQLSVAVPPGATVLTNTPVRRETNKDGVRVVEFEETVRMSTYLLAIVVGDLVGTVPRTAAGTEISVWCVPGRERLTPFAEEIAAYSLQYLRDYYDEPYPESKLDLIAIPDFAAGAMENLGAITFRETALLVDEDTAAQGELQRVAEVVAHENAHMWFGDLVTMAWWNGLWLNEAFATLMEVKCVDAWKPDWDVWTGFGVAREEAFEVDGLQSTRPVEFPVTAPKDAEAMFDVLTYEKGASVLRMFEQYLGEDVFRDGVRRYLQTHRFQNADTEDLWRSLGSAAAEDVPSLMNPWVFTPGYPLLHVRMDEGHVLKLTQERFRYRANDDAPEQLWPVPVRLRARMDDRPRDATLLMEGAEASMDLGTQADWVLANQGGHGFYRVLYEAKLLERLLGALDELAPIERYTLVSDLWAATLAGRMDAPRFLDCAEAFQGERDRNVWTMLASSFQEMHRVAFPEMRPGLAARVRALSRSAFQDLGWVRQSTESQLTGRLRGDLIRLLGTVGAAADVRAQARELFFSEGPLDADVQAAIVPVVAATGDEELYAEFVRRQGAATTPQEERRYLMARAQFPTAELVLQTLEDALAGRIRFQDGPLVASIALKNPLVRREAWAFVRDHWTRMGEVFPKQALRRMCAGIEGLAEPELERDAQRFFSEGQIDLGGRAVEQALERLRIVVAFGERENARLAAYLDPAGSPA